MRPHSAEHGPTPATTGGLWINPVVGVAGDMLLGALLDAGASSDAVVECLSSLGIEGWTLEVTPTTRRGITATSVTVTLTDERDAPDDADPDHHSHDHHSHDHHIPDHHSHDHRSWSTIDAMLVAADLPDEARDGARRTFRSLAVAEAAVHGIDVDDVHFHEVGAIDAIVDIVGCWAAWWDLGAPAVTSGPIGLGVGTATMEHGTVPVPAPATLELLRGAPTVPVDAAGETATPTGAALLVTMATGWGPMPAGTVGTVGRGAGTWDPPSHANVVTAVLFDPDRQSPAATTLPGRSVDAVVVETNVDDVTAEVLGEVISAAIELGADDAWVLPATMKKSRPGHQVRVLCSPDLVPAVRELLARETGTLGWRESPVTKHELDRSTAKVEVDGHTIGIKVGPFGAKAEHDDVVAAARSLDRPVREVAADALTRWSDALRGEAAGHQPHPENLGTTDR